jgi:hypothetical protein
MIGSIVISIIILILMYFIGRWLIHTLKGKIILNSQGVIFRNTISLISFEWEEITEIYITVYTQTGSKYEKHTKRGSIEFNSQDGSIAKMKLNSFSEDDEILIHDHLKREAQANGVFVDYFYKAYDPDSGCDGCD